MVSTVVVSSGLAVVVDDAVVVVGSDVVEIISGSSAFSRVGLSLDGSGEGLNSAAERVLFDKEGTGERMSSTKVGREGRGGGAEVVVNKDVSRDESWAAKFALFVSSAGLSKILFLKCKLSYLLD